MKFVAVLPSLFKVRFLQALMIRPPLKSQLALFRAA